MVVCAFFKKLFTKKTQETYNKNRIIIELKWIRIFEHFFFQFSKWDFLKRLIHKNTQTLRFFNTTCSSESPLRVQSRCLNPPAQTDYTWHGCCDPSDPVLDRLWKCFSSGFKCSSHRVSMITWRLKYQISSEQFFLHPLIILIKLDLVSTS